MRWMVGTDNPDRSASVFWSMPRSALAARNWPAVIIRIPWLLISGTSIMGT